MEYYRSNLAYARDAVPEDVTALKDNLRQSTVDELWAAHHLAPEQSLRYSLDISVFAFSIVVGDEVAAMGGVFTPDNLLADRTRLWFLTSKKLDKVEISFLRQCRKFIKMMLEIYPTLYNFVDVRNEPALKWLKWIGAEFGTVIPFGLDNRMFQYFEFKKKV